MDYLIAKTEIYNIKPNKWPYREYVQSYIVYSEYHDGNYFMYHRDFKLKYNSEYYKNTHRFNWDRQYFNKRGFKTHHIDSDNNAYVYVRGENNELLFKQTPTMWVAYEYDDNGRLISEKNSLGFLEYYDTEE